MPEIWFRYGGTEVSLEIPDDLRYRILEPRELKPDERLWREVGAFADNIGRDAGSRGFTILYDHSGDKLPLIILRHLADSLEQYSDKIRVIVSSWRLDPSEGWEDARKGLKEYGVRAEILGVRDCEMEEFAGMRVVKELLDGSVKLIFTASEPHGLFGKASLREALVLGGFAEVDLSEDVQADITRAWSRLVEGLRPWAITVLNDRLYMGDAEDVAKSVYGAECEIPVEDFDAVLAGCGGRPRDSSFQLIAHIIGLLRDSVVDGGLIGLVAECSRGLGSKSFMEAILDGGGTQLDRALARLIRAIPGDRKIALVTTLPRSIMRRLLDIRCFDAPEDMLTYVLRRYTREARILILEKPHAKPIRRSMRGQS
ncbi:MAG: hypothetical protein QXI18_01925 [Nitrososphaerota archaeon]